MDMRFSLFTAGTKKRKSSRDFLVVEPDFQIFGVRGRLGCSETFDGFSRVQDS